MGDRHAEHGRDRVADELLEAAPVTLHRSAGLIEVHVEDRAKDLGIVRLRQRRGADEVAEEDSDEPALHGQASGWGTARRAEPRACRKILPAG